MWCIAIGTSPTQGPHSETCQRLQVYQIRHMIAMAVCAATARLPMSFVYASLSRQSRMTLPLAPAPFLVLRDSTFHSFPTGGGDLVSPIAALSGPRLTLREQGSQNRAAFENQVGDSWML